MRTLQNTSKSFISTGFMVMLLSASVALTGCAGSSNEQNATIAGSIIGGAAGYQFGKGKGKRVATVLGAIAGGMIGANIGRGMDQQDRQNINYALDNSANNQSVAWQNPNTQSSYEFTPVSSKYQDNVNGQQTQCRNYVMDAWIDGRKQQVYGKACKNANGQWVNKA